MNEEEQMATTLPLSMTSFVSRVATVTAPPWILAAFIHMASDKANPLPKQL